MAEGKKLGLDGVLDYTEAVPAALDGSFDVIFDVHGSLVPKVTGRLTKRGSIVVDINPTTGKMLARLISKRQKLLFTKGSRENLEAVLDLAAQGRLRVPVNQVRPFDEAIALIAALEAGQRVSGRSVITFS